MILRARIDRAEVMEQHASSPGADDPTSNGLQTDQSEFSSLLVYIVMLDNVQLPNVVDTIMRESITRIEGLTHGAGAHQNDSNCTTKIPPVIRCTGGGSRKNGSN
jgi:hypothetical protein